MQILVILAMLLFYPFFTVFILRLILFWNDLKKILVNIKIY